LCDIAGHVLILNMDRSSADIGGAASERVREVLDRALRLPPGDRSSYLDQICGGDGSMRAEVESLINAAARSDVSGETAVTTTVTISNPALGVGVAPGKKISHYEILAGIGEGGMGAVYKALDTNLGRTVALKLISRASITAGDKRRFAREARAASALNHPNIVTIYEYNSDDGLDFIAMEFVDGVPLDRLLRQGGQPIPVLLEYARQVASALAKAHGSGVVHRDLKPGNIMITTEGVAKVLDFGLAKQEAGGSGQGATALTQVGVVMGTPAYMSPEQAMGETADYRSDIFSFGVILYEMVCGRRPFQGGDAHTTLRQIVYREPDPMGEGVPGNVSDLISKCLRKKREERLPSMEDAVALLSHPGPPLSRIRSWKRAPAAIAATLVVMFAASLLSLSPAVREKIRARIPVTRRSGAVADSVDGSASELTLRARNLLRRYDKTGNLDRAIRLLEAALEKDRKFAPAYAAIAEAYLRKGTSITSADDHWLKLARDAATQAVSANPDLAAAHSILADVLLQSKESGAAKPELDRAMQLDPLASAPYLSLAKFDSESNPEDAEQAYKKAVELAPEDWIPHSEYGKFLYRAAHYQAAAEEWKQALRLADNNIFMLRNVGAAYQMLSEPEKAASAFQKALEIQPDAGTWNNLATLRFFQGNYSESVKGFQKAVDIDPNNYLYWGNLGDAYRWSPGQRDKAGAPYSQAITLARDLLNRTPQDSRVRGNLALYLAKSGNSRAALLELKQLAAAPKARPEDLFHTALAYEVMGNRDSALDALGQAMRAGYSLRDIKNEPELAELRADIRYRNLLSQTPARK
jgi:serine/threonine protein kinase/tetratricopeptide (TPR) repeat protein